MSDFTPMPVIYLPHGGGPLPLFDDPAHRPLTAFMRTLGDTLPRPRAVLVVSAHWEQPQPTLTASRQPELIYDYYGFPPESYRLRYPAPGDPALAESVAALLRDAGFDPQGDPQRGFDHGLFVPLTLIYPAADIPCLQLSLLASLDAARHIALGQALTELRRQGVLILGSGLSFHNLRAMLAPNQQAEPSEAFDRWLTDICCAENYSAAQRQQALIQWRQAPHARYCHPREEHLLPLHVCVGAAGGAPAKRIFSDKLMGQQVSGYRWG